MLAVLCKGMVTRFVCMPILNNIELLGGGGEEEGGGVRFPVSQYVCVCVCVFLFFRNSEIWTSQIPNWEEGGIGDRRMGFLVVFCLF